MSFLPIRILIIEEHPFKRVVASQVFQGLGCVDVITVADNAEALDLLGRTGRVDIVLYSLKTHCTQGLAWIEELGRSGLFRSVIICSVYSNDLHSAIERMLSMHGVKVLGYVNTVVNANEISTLVGRFLELLDVRQPDVSIPASFKLSSRSELEKAIQCDEFKAFFQPKFKLVTGAVDSFEVLVRWEHPRHGLLYPGEFLPLLSEFKLMDDLLFAQLEQGFIFLRNASAAGRQLNLAFNLQAEQLGNPVLVARIKELIKRYGVPAFCLTFEITESGLLEMSPTILERLICLRMMGVGLSLDDFGVGFSSLERLCQLPFTEIKLDAGFIRDLGTSARNRIIVGSTLALGRALNMAVVIEGVETENQRKLLIELGCTQAQGYLCAHPMSAERTLAWLDQKYAFINDV
ncbi:EAL domain-containing response regulator [Pseudomonas lactis]|uniref:Cyclic diguanylate phosphodiesterase (EAL) domain protein n=1 Tax=Pseudomonas lactis TaxID=1615674 RepID=I4KG00_9PSED|nr:EAL domain-containing response regulator [Pseudomonas lactis]EIK63640.1 cyclic diguanylate phosphodiesterase (EAL) domain protein [Pseudomonas lactis]